MLRVQVVDKDQHLRRLLNGFLSGFELRFFDDGYSALDAARKEPPALVLTEILVPRLDGLALCRALKSEQPPSSIKVMILTILAAEERARQAGCDAFLKKPIERSSLLATVRSLVGTPTAETRP